MDFQKSALEILKMKLKNVRFMFLLLEICVIFGWNLIAQNLVVLDPGHGGNDRGTTSQKMTYEKDVVLRVAKEMVKLNKNLYNDKLDIYLTRYADTLIALGDRSRLAKMLQADMFISLHCSRNELAVTSPLLKARAKSFN